MMDFDFLRVNCVTWTIWFRILSIQIETIGTSIVLVLLLHSVSILFRRFMLLLQKLVKLQTTLQQLSIRMRTFRFSITFRLLVLDNFVFTFQYVCFLKSTHFVGWINFPFVITCASSTSIGNGISFEG
jgi:hypothetical protein